MAFEKKKKKKKMLADDVAMADELSDSAVNDETGYGVFNL